LILELDSSQKSGCRWYHLLIKQLEQARRSVSLLANWRTRQKVQSSNGTLNSYNLVKEIDKATNSIIDSMCSDEMPSDVDEWTEEAYGNTEMPPKDESSTPPTDKRNEAVLKILETLKEDVDERLVTNLQTEFKRLLHLNNKQAEYISHIAELMGSMPQSFDAELTSIKSSIEAGGIVFGIGQNDDGQVGIPNDEHNGGYPCTLKFRKVEIHPSIKITKFACGAMHTLAITSDGWLLSWGFDECLGRSGREDIPGLVEFPKGIFIQDVACTEYASVCLDNNGELWTWGAFRVILID
jgi:hypothetical protein